MGRSKNGGQSNTEEAERNRLVTRTAIAVSSVLLISALFGEAILTGWVPVSLPFVLAVA